MKTIVLSLGGSVIYPSKPDYNFIKNFKELIQELTKNNKFAIYCGGGKLARNLQDKAKKEGNKTQEELDWIGIGATKKNAEMMQEAFKDIAEEKLIIDPTEEIILKKQVVLAAGWKPGWSTDYDAVLLAKNLEADIVINITNVDYVYNKNPKQHKDARSIKEIKWKEFRKLVGDKWDPGLNMPFDPIASREAEKSKLKVIIIGRNLSNLKNCLENKKFKGTVITT